MKRRIKRFNNGQDKNSERKHGCAIASRWQLIKPAVAITGVALIVAVAAAVSISLQLATTGQAQAINPNSPKFANPSEITYRAGEKRVRGIMKIVSGEYEIPNVGVEKLRQYRGWDPTVRSEPTATTAGPGPTLRAKLGDQVQLSFLNQVNKRDFPYTIDTEPMAEFPSYGCDQSGTPNPATRTTLPYPGNDIFPNCFHGSSTANIHFHGTHTSPDGLGDNVLIQILPQFEQPDWTKTFEGIFDSRKIPQKWADMPPDYRNLQMKMIKDHDAWAAAEAAKNKLPAPMSLLAKDQAMIDSGQWPQYLMGAFPNFFNIPDYDKDNGAFNSGGNGYDAGQAPGTHWYHAHKHGSTNIHIRNGLAGAFVIESSHEGGYDHFIRKTFGWANYEGHEKILVFQQYDPTANLERQGPTNPGKGSRQILVNGLFRPTIDMRPGEVQLWRLVNATQGNLNGLIKVGTFKPQTTTGLFDTTEFTFRQTAQDGVQFSPSNYKNQPFLDSSPTSVPGGLVLAAGNRADLLVQAPTSPGVVPFKNGPGGDILFFVNVTGPVVSMPPIPTDTWAEMPTFLKDLASPPVKDVSNILQFQWDPGRANVGRNPTFPPHFMINGKQFAATGDIVDQCMPLKGLQDWILENYTVGAAHPFHIHINPFQVISIETPSQPDLNKPPKYSTYTPTDNFIWQDVIAIPPAVISEDGKQITPGRVRIRQKFLDFPGTFVLHCHILAHEDRGMMQLVRVIPADQYPNRCQSSVPTHH